jgi:hypothetical protein
MQNTEKSLVLKLLPSSLLEQTLDDSREAQT